MRLCHLDLVLACASWRSPVQRESINVLERGILGGAIYRRSALSTGHDGVHVALRCLALRNSCCPNVRRLWVRVNVVDPAASYTVQVVSVASQWSKNCVRFQRHSVLVADLVSTRWWLLRKRHLNRHSISTISATDGWTNFCIWASGKEITNKGGKREKKARKKERKKWKKERNWEYERNTYGSHSIGCGKKVAPYSFSLFSQHSFVILIQNSFYRFIDWYVLHLNVKWNMVLLKNDKVIYFLTWLATDF